MSDAAASAPSDPAPVDPSLEADASPDLPGESRPSHYRLDAAVWAAIAEQYKAGATAKALSQVWRVSPGSIYRHASAEGWTKATRSKDVSALMLARDRERRAHAERIEGAAEQAALPREADPLEAAESLLRRGAGSALKGRGEQAKGELGLAQDLMRCARLLQEVKGIKAGEAARRARAWPAAPEAADDDDDEEPEGWRDSDEAKALRAQIIQGLHRLRRRMGREPPQALPEFVLLEDEPRYRALAEALDLVDETGGVLCPDFPAAVAACRAAGRGPLLDAALTTPLPLELCPWLTEGDREEAAPVVAAAPASAEADEETAFAVDDGGGAESEPPPAERRVQGLSEADEPWSRLRRPWPPGISEPPRSISR